MTDDFTLEAPEPKPKRKIVKPQYTELFEKWWDAYPRKTAKFKAFQSWQSHVDERDTAAAVIADTEKRTRMQFWAADKSKIPMPTTFLNQHRWEDEWEDEVKTRGRENIATAHRTSMPTIATENTGPLLSGWETMVNRLMRNYLFKAGGFSDERLKQFKATKARVLKQMMPVIDEEIALAETPEDKKRVRNEMGWLLGKTLMNNLDIDLCLNLGPQILNMTRKDA